MKGDASNRAIERATEMVGRIRKIVEKRVPTGPNQVRLTPAEVRRLMSGLGEEERRRVAQGVGLEEGDELIRRMGRARQT